MTFEDFLEDYKDLKRRVDILERVGGNGMVWGALGGTIADQTDLQSELDGKSDVGHTHTESDITDLDKYTQAEVDALLATKAASNHNHAATYTAPTLLNSWVNYDTTYNKAGYFKDTIGVVHLRGLVKNGTVGAAIFTLPAGFRPIRRMLFAVCTNPNAIGRCDVDTSGNVIANVGSNTWFSLDGLTFLAEQ